MLMDEAAFVSKLRKSVKRVRAKEDSTFAFCFFRDRSRYSVYIDAVPGKKPTRFKTPKLIDAHLQKLGVSEGLGVPLRECRSCAGTVECHDGVLRFRISSRAGRASPADLSKGLRRPELARILGAAEVAMTEEEHEDEFFRFSDAATATIDRQHEALMAPVRDPDDLEALGAYLAVLYDLAESEPDRWLQERVETLEALYDVLSEDLDRSGLREAYREACEDIDGEEELLGVISERSEALGASLETAGDTIGDAADKLDEFASIGTDLLSGDFAKGAVTDQLGKLSEVAEGNPRLKGMLSVFREADEILSDTIGVSINEELQQQIDRFGDAASEQLKDALSGAKSFVPIDSIGMVTENLRTLQELFKSGAQGAFLCGKLSKAAAEVKVASLEANSETARSLQSYCDVYSSSTSNGGDFMTGLERVYTAGFLAGKELKLTGEACARLGPLSGVIQHQLDVYARSGGSLNFEQYVNLSEGIIKLNLGASIGGTVGMKLAIPKMKFSLEGIGRIEADGMLAIDASLNADASGTISLHGDTLIVEGQAGFKASVGAEYDVGASVKDSDGNDVFKFRSAARVAVGVELHASGRFEIKGGRIYIRWEYSAALGVGGGSAGEMEITNKALVQLFNSKLIAALKTFFTVEIAHLSPRFRIQQKLKRDNGNINRLGGVQVAYPKVA